MECTMPKATFTPTDNKKALEYIVECLDEASRGLSFVKLDGLNISQLKNKINQVNATLYDRLRFLERS